MAAYIQVVEERMLQTTMVLAYVAKGRVSRPVESMLAAMLGSVNYRPIGSYKAGTLFCTGAHNVSNRLVVHLLYRELPWNLLLRPSGELIGAPIYEAKKWPIPVGTKLVRELRP